MAQALLNNSDNQRTLWRITLPATKVLEGATKKLEFHKGRYDTWVKARDETKKKIRERGVILDESVLAESVEAMYSNSGRPPSAIIDNTLMKDLDEANRKIQEHKDKCRSFESWIEFLEAATGDLELTLSDYLYFFGK
jgi:hypothetical protein